MPRSATEYILDLLKQLPWISSTISEPFHPKQIFKIDNDYVTGAKKQLDIIKELASNNSLILKEIHIANVKHQLSMWKDKDDIGVDLSENIELMKVFDEYKSLIENNFYKIKLVRNNLFDLTLSMYLAIENNTWHYTGTKFNQTIVNTEYFKNLLWDYKIIYDSLIDYPGCQETLTYEKLTGDYSIDCNLIKCIDTPFDFQQRIFKNSDKKELIVNYNEIIEIYEQYSK